MDKTVTYLLLLLKNEKCKRNTMQEVNTLSMEFIRNAGRCKRVNDQSNKILRWL